VSYKRHRFPLQIIAHAVLLYFRFPLSLRHIEEMLLERGMVLSYETVRRCSMKFGTDYARRLKGKKPDRCDVLARGRPGRLRPEIVQGLPQRRSHRAIAHRKGHAWRDATSSLASWISGHGRSP
jgi:hypothetical protein